MDRTQTMQIEPKRCVLKDKNRLDQTDRADRSDLPEQDRISSRPGHCRARPPRKRRID